MNKIEKIKFAVDVAKYYFTIYATLYILRSLIIPYLLYRNITGLRYAIMYVPLIVISIFLVIISKVLKRKVQVGISIDSKPLLYLIVGVMFIITGITLSQTFILSLIALITNHNPLKSYLYTGVMLIIYVVLIGIGAYLTFMTIKRDKQIEKIKFAVDVALYYFAINTLLYVLSEIIKTLFYNKNYGISFWDILFLPQYVVFAVVISFLAIISSVIKRKVYVSNSIDSKLLLYIIVGFLLIVDGVTRIPLHISRISYLYHSASTVQGAKDILMNSMYLTIIPIASTVIQIGIGAYFILMTIKRDKQIGETR
jgi:hypothetical protein